MGQKQVSVGTSGNPVSLSTNFSNIDDNFDEVYTTLADAIELVPDSTIEIDSGTGAINVKAGTYDLATPACLDMTSSAVISSAQLLANKFFTNLGASGAVVATLPAVSYPITRTFLVSATQVFSIKPPTGETLDTTISPILDANDKISSPATIHSKAVATRVPVGAAWVWSIDVVRGTWTDGGA